MTYHTDIHYFIVGPKDHWVNIDTLEQEQLNSLKSCAVSKKTKTSVPQTITAPQTNSSQC